MLLYHYTSGFGIACILKEGVIRPRAPINPEEKASVWLTLSEEWEKTVMPPEGFLRVDWVKWRIGVEPSCRLVSFDEWKTESGCREEAMRWIERDSTSNWRVAFEELPYHCWRKIERMEDSQWKEVEFSRWRQIISFPHDASAQGRP